jgi:hypothetical protein
MPTLDELRRYLYPNQASERLKEQARKQRKNAGKQLNEIKQLAEKTDFEYGEELAKIVMPECPNKMYAGFGFIVGSVMEISKFSDKTELAELLRDLCYSIEEGGMRLHTLVDRKMDFT